MELTESRKCRLTRPPKGWKLERAPSLLGTGEPREGDPGSGLVRGIVYRCTKSSSLCRVFRL